jgi:hypothetical protein
MEALHESGIECGVQSIRGDRWEVWLGNDCTGRHAQESELNLNEAAAWLDWKSRTIYPEADYSRTPLEPEVAQRIEAALARREPHAAH